MIRSAQQSQARGCGPTAAAMLTVFRAAESHLIGLGAPEHDAARGARYVANVFRRRVGEGLPAWGEPCVGPEDAAEFWYLHMRENV